VHACFWTEPHSENILHACSWTQPHIRKKKHKKITKNEKTKKTKKPVPEHAAAAYAAVMLTI
jgi:hypothetical protein